MLIFFYICLKPGPSCLWILENFSLWLQPMEKKGVSKKGKVCLEMIIDRTGRRLGGKGEIFIGKGYWETFGCRKWGVLFNMDP